MEDKDIIRLYIERSEAAISETADKYGKYCHSIAYRILYSNEDAEECVNDTYQKVWCSIPPDIPSVFRAYIGRIARNIALNRYDFNKAQKRCPDMEMVLYEYGECIAGAEIDLENEIALKSAIDQFLHSLKKQARIIFLRRYWYMYSVAEISKQMKLSESNVKVSLFRTRAAMREFLSSLGLLD